MRFLILFLALLLALAACFDPTQPDGALLCGPAPDVCPPGFACRVDGHCWSGGEAGDGGAPVPDGREAHADARPRQPDARRPACSDGIDNDCDGLTDWPDDPGCSGPDDDDEHGTNECDDGIDNDHDGKIDFHVGMRCGPGDDKCKSPLGDREH
jgi:hypothetical protein